MMKHEHQWVPHYKEQRSECDFVECGAAQDWRSKPSRIEGIYDAYPEDPDLVHDVDFRGTLYRINALTKSAVEALDDEHEGNFKDAVNRLEVLSVILKRTVDRM